MHTYSEEVIINMATEFARRLADANVADARRAIADLEFSEANVSKLAQLLTNFRRAELERRRVHAEALDG